MAAALEGSPVSYEDLADIEREFDEADTEIIRQQIKLTEPLYLRRSKTVSQIENFWPLVLEQAPPDIDQHIQPSDSALLLSSLTSLSVSHFEASLPNGDPRSVSISFSFSPNEYFEDEVLEKKFWHRRGKNGWTGLVSEPVGIRWKKDRDLTGGLLDLVLKAEKSDGKRDKEGLTAEQRQLKKKIDGTGMGGLSFFAWFGFVGRRISAEESLEATNLEKEKRRKRQVEKDAGTKNGKEDKESQHGEEEEEEEDEDDEVGMSLEIFPDGDDLAIAFTEDLWPGAIKYFTQAQEQDAMSDADFESDEEERGDTIGDVEEGGSEDEDERPSKKMRAS